MSTSNSNMIFGSLQGPPLPETEYERLPLGKQPLRIASVTTKPSAKGDSVNVNFLVTGGGRGTGFLRINLRHIPFRVGNQNFEPWLHPAFLTNGLSQLEGMANASLGDISKQATSELNRARIAISQIRALKRWAGTLDNNLFDPKSLIGLEFDGAVVYRDENDLTMRITKDGTKIVKAKKGAKRPDGADFSESDFDYGSASAEIATVYRPKSEEPASEE